MNHPSPTCFSGNFVFFNLARAYHALRQEHGQTVPEPTLYEAARRAWVMAACRKPLVQFAAIVFEGVVVQVYEVQRWQDFVMPNGRIRAEFTGKPVLGAKRAHCVGQPADPYMPRGAGFVVASNFDC